MFKTQTITTDGKQKQIKREACLLWA